MALVAGRLANAGYHNLSAAGGRKRIVSFFDAHLKPSRAVISLGGSSDWRLGGSRPCRRGPLARGHELVGRGSLQV